MKESKFGLGEFVYCVRHSALRPSYIIYGIIIGVKGSATVSCSRAYDYNFSKITYEIIRLENDNISNDFIFTCDSDCLFLDKEEMCFLTLQEAKDYLHKCVEDL